MKKRLSTSFTFFLKFIFPSIWLIGLGFGAIGIFIAEGIVKSSFLITLIFGFCLLYYGCLRAKEIHIDDNYLYISNFRKNIKVPLENIKNVSDNILFSPRPIFVEFHNKTDFGMSIMFIGYTDIFLFFATHAAVKEILTRKSKPTE